MFRDLSLEKSRLGPLTKIGGGTQGTVFFVPNVRIPLVGSAVFKEYEEEKLAAVDFAALARMVSFLESLTMGEGTYLIQRAAWPARLVSDQGIQRGFIMPEVSHDFRIHLSLSSGKVEVVLAKFQYLLNDDSYLVSRDILISDRDRWQLLADVAGTLDFLHAHRITVGDFSPNNLLFAIQPERRCFFVDCDSMQIDGQGVLPQLETPDWEVHVVSPEPRATAASDVYKLALLALRLLAGHQSTRDPADLPAGRVPGDVRALIEHGLSRSPSARPPAGEWLTPLTVAATNASSATPPPIAVQQPGGTSSGNTLANQSTNLGQHVGTAPKQTAPPPPVPPRGGQTPRSRRPAILAGLAVLTAFLVILVITSTRGSGPSSSGGLSATPKAAGYAMTTQATNIPASPTLDAIKSRGKIVIGTKFDQPLFGLKNPVSGNIDGFDAEMSRIVAKRVLGDDKKIDFVETVSKNREDFIEQGKVDAVIATYTINDARKQRVGFAGPYYLAGQDIMVKKDNTTIKSVADLNGKKVSSVQGSTSERIIKSKAPQAQVLLFDTYTTAAEALRDGRVDADSTDNVILLGLVDKNPDAFKLVGAPFTQEPYGIGVKKDDTVFRNFVNDTLAEAERNGDWQKAYAATAGKVDPKPPTPPAIERY